MLCIQYDTPPRPTDPESCGTCVAPAYAKVAQTYQLTFFQRNTSDILVMNPSTAFCKFQLVAGSYLQAGLMFPNPLVNIATNRIVNPAYEEINRESWFLTKHQQKQGLPSCLMWSGVIGIKNLRETRTPVVFTFY